ncbi:MAG: hypothetical protein JNK76_21340 [Planctomycetales bacterium]|nr:hypothetical protein [Planctomycetales bacterium]MBN8626373.1 hypothetical protein [Planctomycetota bacterium]
MHTWHKFDRCVLGMLLCLVVADGSVGTAEAEKSRADDSEVFQLRVVAMNDRYATAVKAAVFQQAAERLAGRSPTRDVKHPESGNIVARWVNVAPSAVKQFKDLKSAQTRTVDGADKAQTLQVLVIADKWNIGHADVDQARGELDDREMPMVAFEMTDAGGKKLSALTSAHLPNENAYFHLAIIVGDEAYAAPRIQSVISDRGLITGNFTAAEVEKLVDLMNAVPVSGN